MTAIGRITWSKGGKKKRGPEAISGYYDDGSFAFRITHPQDVAFMTRLIIGGLAKVREEIASRIAEKEKSKSQDVEGAPV